MQHVISNHDLHLADHNSYTNSRQETISIISRFIAWCDNQQKNSFMWLGVAFLGGIGTVLPITLCAIVFIGGNSLPLWIMACAINVPILIIHLALQSTKYTLPVLFFAWSLDVLIILYCLAYFFIR